MKLNIVPARTGIAWVKSGIGVFWRQPMAMGALFFMAMAAMSIASLVPLIGPVVALMVLPSVTLTMMVASAEALQGRFPTPAVLLVAFRTGRERLRHMLVLGALYALGFLVVIGISALFDGGQFAQVYLGGEPMARETAESGEFQLAMWVAMLLYLPLSLLFWHAPGLVHWHGVPPVKSLFFSIVACLRNFGAFTMYGLAWLGVFALGGVLVSLVSTLLVVLGLFSAEAAPSAIGGLMVGLAMMMAAMFFSSIVFTFRDCFEPPEKSPLAPALPTPVDLSKPSDSSAP
ncbi:MAG: BPSS1780 family membrane protein [Simplicispira sp.]|nr:BPSS1780 family membrane protein [Simplicispira sp.]